MKFLAAFALCLAVANAFDSCTVCENVLKPIMDKATPADVTKVVDILKGLCFGNAECVKKVEDLGEDITKSTPESLCTLVDMCKAKVPVKRNLFDICSICEEGVDAIKSHLSNETIDEIRQKLEVLCFSNPTCIAKIDSVAADVATTSSQEICTDLHLCSAKAMFKYTGGRFCHLCERVVGEYLDKFLNNATLEKVEQTMNAACRGNAQCLDAVAKIMVEIESVNAKTVCRSIHLCGGPAEAGSFMAPNKCEACKTKLESTFSDETLKTIEADLKKMCFGIELCSNTIDQFITSIKNNRETYVKDICTISRQC